MVNVNGQPFITHQLELLKSQGVEEVVLCVGHLEKPLRDFVGDGTRFGLKVRYSSDYSGHSQKLLGTGGAVLQASKLVTSPFAVLYGDSFLDLPFQPFAEAFAQTGKLALMTVYRNINRGGPSNLLVKDGQVIAYDKENPTANMEHIDYGLIIFSTEAFAGFSEGEPFDLAEIVKRLIAQGRLACHEVDMPFHEVGTKEGLDELEAYLVSRQKQLIVEQEGNSF
jgi:NDP-sugar pyrophosphorylase family protein